MFLFISIFSVAVSISLYWLWKEKEKLVFNPDRVIYPVYTDDTFEITNVWTGEKNKRINGWYVTPSSLKGNSVLLICHGTKGNLTTPFRMDLVRALAILGLEFFIFDYRGTGLSTGRISEENVKEDALTAWNYLTDIRKIGHQRIIVFGRSLGGPVAAFLASEKDPVMLVLESTFTCLSDEASSLVPSFLPRSLSSFVFARLFDTVGYLKNASCPLVCVHGSRDRLVSYSLGVELYRRYSGKKVMVTLKGLGHKGFSVDPAAYARALYRGIDAAGSSVQEK